MLTFASPAARSLRNVPTTSRAAYIVVGRSSIAACQTNRFNQSTSIVHRAQRRFLRREPEPAMATSPPFNQLVLYTARTPNGLKPALMLEELGLHYKVEGIDIMKNTQKEQWFLDINPNGRIPALKDGDMRIFESGAIMLYLHDHYDPEKKFGYANGSPLYYEMVSWLMFQMGGLGPMAGMFSCCTKS